eukprot:13823_1
MSRSDKWEHQKALLFDYCNTHKEISKAKTKYKGYNIGHWLGKQKVKISSKEDDLYIQLSKNEYVKQSLDKCLNKRKNKLSADEKMLLLFEYCDVNKRYPKGRAISYKNVKIGKWLDTQKGNISSKEDSLYIKLAKKK